MDNDKGQTQQPVRTQSRRTVLKAMAGIPVLGIFALELMEKKSYELKNKNKLIKELGLEDMYAPNTISNSAKGELLRIGIVGFGSRAVQLAKGIGFMHPDDMERNRKNGRLDNWLAQENLNVAITGICDVFDLNAEKGLATAKNEVLAGGAKPSGLPVKRYRTYQEMLADDSIDAVIVATPDHHHARITTDAVKAGVFLWGMMPPWNWVGHLILR